ncbi:MAG TPA: hypothetical protein VHO69_14880 [Phototrophicaceae bacterium]|nr:hypothetical protein [Phototrophicaceae bacterium]
MPPTNKRFVIPFENGQAAFAVHSSEHSDPAQAARLLGFTQPCPTIYVTGGAGAMSAEDIHATQTLVERGLARFAEDHHAAVIDGGTDTGIPTMLGSARRKCRYHFPLIGIAPLERVRFQGYVGQGEDTTPLNPGHSHFVLTTGDDFGDESKLITKMTATLSGAGQQPALGVLINGGKIARQEVYARTTSSRYSFPLIVVEGSGRFADILARAFYAGHTEEKDVQAIISKGQLEMVSIDDGPEQMYAKLAAHFRAFKPTSV